MASAASESVRFAAPNRVARLKLEVLSASGEVLTELSTPGSVLDWMLSDSQGLRLQDGRYLCVLTVKDVTGRMTQRLTLVEIMGEEIVTRPASAKELTAEQAEAVGPVEAEEATPVAEGEAPAATLLAHDGREGQLVTTSGDLSFRSGDFFAGRDQELMRLSSDGSLTVEGSLLARGGIRFPDGTALESADGIGSSGRNANGAKVGTLATANRLVKYLDGAGTQGDSAVVEDAGRVGIGTASPAQALHVFGKGLFQNTGRASVFILDRTDGKIAAFGGGGISSTFAYDQSGIFKIESNSRANIAQGVFGSATGATTRLAIDTSGNVGVGTETPGYKLDVAGTLRASRNISNDIVVQTTSPDDNAWARLWMITQSQAWAWGTSQNFNGNQLYLADLTNQSQSRMTVQPGGGPIIFPHGSVGIGIAPSARLHVSALGASAFNNTAMFSAPDIGPNASHIHYGTTGDWYIRSALDTGKVVLQDTNGKVGIGTSNPTVGKLEVQTAASNSAAVFGRATGSGSAGGQFEGTAQGVVGIGTSTGMYARVTSQAGTALYADCANPSTCLAGRFNGSVSVQGYVTATGFDSTSDREAKTNFAAVDPRSVLHRLASLPVHTWKFKQGGAARHMGPVAQDFRAAFGLGRDDRHIATVDADGVMMASIQGLYQIVQEKEKEIEQLRARLERLEHSERTVRPDRRR